MSDLLDLLQAEIVQRKEEGCDVGSFQQQVASEGVAATAETLDTWFEELDALQPASDFVYREPSDLESIRRERVVGPPDRGWCPDTVELEDRLLGAWLGRCAGCMLGKPVEGWPRAWIQEYLELAGEYPLHDYLPLLEPLPDRFLFHPSDHRETMRGHIQQVVRDDDLDFTILGLLLLEQKGPEFTSQDVANAWLSFLPYHEVYTAERAAYRNLVNGIDPPDTASYRNPYREWIGAQIRADAYGYAAAGLPELAAELAWRDARVSHAKNGIYGAMFVAAMLAAAFTTADVGELIQIGLSQIPSRSRLAEAVKQVVAWHKQCESWEDAVQEINRNLGSYHWIHTVNNAAIVVMGLLYGEGDLGRSITIAVMGGWDTDCNGATVGSIVGAITGAAELPAQWVEPLNDTLRSHVAGYDNSRISDLAGRTAVLARRIRAYAQTGTLL